LKKENQKNKIALLIPAYNEEAYIEKVVFGCLKYKLDILIINDGSTDDTANIIKKIPKPRDSRIIIVEHSINRGKGQSLITGFDYIVKNNYSGVITLDADGQHDVNEIAFFLKAVEEEDPDIIVGNRLGETKGMPVVRLLTNVFTSWIISRIAGRRINDVQSGYRYIKSKALKTIKLETRNFDTEPEILIRASWLDYNIKNIPIKTIYLENTVSHVNPITDTVKFFKLVLKSLKWKRSFFKNKARKS